MTYTYETRYMAHYDVPVEQYKSDNPPRLFNNIRDAIKDIFKLESYWCTFGLQGVIARDDGKFISVPYYIEDRLEEWIKQNENS